MTNDMVFANAVNRNCNHCNTGYDTLSGRLEQQVQNLSRFSLAEISHTAF